jgi:hypothetical protein
MLFKNRYKIEETDVRNSNGEPIYNILKNKKEVFNGTYQESRKFYLLNSNDNDTYQETSSRIFSKKEIIKEYIEFKY